MVNSRRNALKHNESVELFRKIANNNGFFQWNNPCDRWKEISVHNTLVKEWPKRANIISLDQCNRKNMLYAIKEYGDDLILEKDIILFVDGIGWFSESIIILTNKLLLFKDSISQYIVPLKHIEGIKAFDASQDYSFERRFYVPNGVIVNNKMTYDPRFALCGDQVQLNPILNQIIEYSQKLRDVEGDSKQLSSDAQNYMTKANNLLHQNKCEEALKLYKVANDLIPSENKELLQLFSNELLNARDCIFTLLDNNNNNNNDKNMNNKDDL